jgi:hypothetical protein
MQRCKPNGPCSVFARAAAHPKKELAYFSVNQQSMQNSLAKKTNAYQDGLHARPV